MDGNWTEWRAWGPCSLTCGGGSQDRTRSCTNPPPAFGGANCVGKRKEFRVCNNIPCPGVIKSIFIFYIQKCTQLRPRDFILDTFFCIFLMSLCLTKLPWGTPGNSWCGWVVGESPDSSNPDPVSDQKCDFPHPFSDLALRQKLCHHYLD